MGVLKSLKKFISVNVSLTFLENITWVIVNLCRGKKPLLCRNFVQELLPCLSELIHHCNILILVDTLWALSHLTHENRDFIQLVIDSGVCLS